MFEMELTMRTVLPAIGLFFLAPLVAEFLLGNLAISALGALVVLAPLYGGGAVLIREVVRRTGRGWPSLLLLALAYGVLEEGITTMSLFNPDYAGVRLLDNGFIPQLGIAGPWTVAVLTLHTVWSIGVPIALVESLVPARRTTPWLGRVGLAVVGAVFAFGVAVNTAISIATYHFVASAPQLLASAVVVAVLAGCAFRLGPTPHATASSAAGRAPSPWLVGLASFVSSGIYKMLPNTWSPWVLVGLVLLLDVGAVAVVYQWSRLDGWGDAHHLALAGGALLTYAWSAFPQTPVLAADPTVDLVGNAVFAVGAIALLCVAALRLRHQPAASAGAHVERGLSTLSTAQPAAADGT
jgi:hypothetical protein